MLAGKRLVFLGFWNVTLMSRILFWVYTDGWRDRRDICVTSRGVTLCFGRRMGVIRGLFGCAFGGQN